MKRHGWLLGAAMAAMVFAGQATLPPAGTPQLPLPQAAAPAIKIEDADPAAAKAVGLEGLEVSVVLNGPLAETKVTMTFRNSLNRPLEGELEFPLPEGASVVGYALDVPAGSGNLVEGVCVEKERARRVFESEERRGVDPGIVEMTRGNNYRTRVHPIPAGGTRTVQLTYVSDLTSAGETAVYRMPLEFGNLKNAKIHIEVAAATKPDEVKIAGLPAMVFAPRNGHLVADKSMGAVALSGTLTVTQPLKADEVYTSVEGGYFMVSAVVPAVALNFKMPRIDHLTIVWDTSLSRVGADRTAEYEALRGILKATSASYTVYGMDGKVLRGGPSAMSEPGQRVDELIAFLKGMPCDGALNVDGVQQVLQALSMKQTEARPRGTCLLFSDGLVTMGKGRFQPDNMTVYAVCSDPKADHAFLKRVAEGSGGLYLNLQRMKPEEAGQAMTTPAMVAGFEWGNGETTKLVVQELYPAAPTRVVPGQRVTFAGQLHANEVKGRVVLNVLGSVNGPAWTKEVTLSSGAVATGIVSRYWAQQKAAWLGADPERNAEALLALAKEFNLVTPETSLLVLETVDQYVRYGIVPPKSRGEIYQEFAKRVETENAGKKKAEGEKIDHILALWKGRVEWWETEFKVPTKDELAAAEKKQSIAGAGGAGGGSGGTAMPVTAQPALSTGGGGGAPSTAAGDSGRELRQLQLQQEAVSNGSQQTATLRMATVDALTAQMKSTGESPDNSSAIAIKAWSPDTPYLKAMSAAPVEKAYDAYLVQRKDFAASPAFYLDCANWLLEHGQRDLGIRVLTSIAQLHLEDAALLRVAAYRLLQAQAYPEAIDLFERAKRLRPEEPQSWRDLAIAISEEALQRSWPQNEPDFAQYKRQMADLQRAMELYNHVVMNQWDRFDEIEVVALMEANALWAKMQRMDGWKYADAEHTLKNPLDSRLLKNLDCDVRVVMTWDADVTDIDLHVIEPTGQEAFYNYNRTLAGGLVSHDFTQGYGPEEYLIHHAVPGTYKIAANFYGSQQQTIQGPVTVQATVITNFGRADEKRQSMTLRLTEQKETVPIGEVTIGK